MPPLPPLMTQAPMQPQGMIPLRIVYNNDPHEKTQAMPHVISAFDYFSKQGEEQNKEVLRLNAGDNNIGPEAKDWELTVLLDNMMHFNAMADGNHEFDLGSKNFANGLAITNAPTIVSNLNIPAQGAFADAVRRGNVITGAMIIPGRYAPYGLIGVTTPELYSVLNHNVDLQNVSPVSFEETRQRVATQIAQLHAQGVNTIIVVSHMGYELEKKLAETVPGITMIVGGHSHDVLNGVVPGKNLISSPTGSPVLLVQAGKNASFMGVADLMVTPQGTLADAKNYLYDPHQFPRNPFAQQLEEQFLGPATTIATLSNKYDNDNNAFEPDPVAELTADALRFEAKSDIAFVRSASVRKSLWPGPFTNHDLHELMPFKDQQVALPMTGQEIYGVLAKSAQTVAKKENHPGFINASGLSYTFDKETGEVLNIRVFNRQTNQWEPLNPQKTYRVACDEFSVTNPSEFPTLGHPNRVDWKSGRTVGTFFEQGLKLKGAPNQLVTLQCDGRSRVI